MNREGNIVDPTDKFVTILTPQNSFTESNTIVPSIKLSGGNKLLYRFFTNFECSFECSFKVPGGEFKDGVLNPVSYIHHSCGDQNVGNWYESNFQEITTATIKLIIGPQTDQTQAYHILFEFISVNG